MNSDDLEKAARHWSAAQTAPDRTRWWESPAIMRHINRRFSGSDSEGTHGGDIALIKSLSGMGPRARAVSVGCGTAAHEFELLKAGAVGHFDLHEIAPARIASIHARAQSLGLSGRITLNGHEPFAGAPSGHYDLVYWKDALHHMYPVLDAVVWSRRVLATGGLFFMNECVAPTYMQWSERQLDLAESVRRLLPPRYLANPHHPGTVVPMRRARPGIAALRASDPSECIDSGNILPSVRAVFPDATVIPTGGIVYMLALNDILANIDERVDEGLLAVLMGMDDLFADAGDSVYAVAHAVKTDPAALWTLDAGNPAI